MLGQANIGISAYLRNEKSDHKNSNGFITHKLKVFYIKKNGSVVLKVPKVIWLGAIPNFILDTHIFRVFGPKHVKMTPEVQNSVGQQLKLTPPPPQ